MQIREWVINKLLPENKIIITKEELSELKFEASHKGHTYIIKEPKKSKTKKKSKTVYLWGESTQTTGVIKYYEHDDSYIYTLMLNGKQKRFKSNNKDKVFDFKDVFLKTDKKESDFKCVAKEINQKYNTLKSKSLPCIYQSSSGRYAVRSPKRVHFGTVDTEAQAEYVSAYLKYKGFPDELRSTQLLGYSCKGCNDYYEHMRLLIRTDEEYLTKHDDKKHLTRNDKLDLLLDTITWLSDNFGGSASLKRIYFEMVNNHNISESEVKDLITLLTSKGVIYTPTAEHYKVA